MAAARAMATLLTVILMALYVTTSEASTKVQKVRLGQSAVAVDGGSNVTNATNTTTAPTASAQLCDAQLLFQKLYVLMPAINQCASESDYFINPSNLSMPKPTSLAKYCGSKNCSLLSQELDNAGLPSCSVQVENTTMPFKVFFKEIKDRCDSSSKSSSSVTSAPSTSASGNSLTFPKNRAWQLAIGAMIIAIGVIV